jgi:hypothetical protein
MLQIVIVCTSNRRFVPTGIETDIDTFIALPETLSLTRCPACGGSLLDQKPDLDLQH